MMILLGLVLLQVIRPLPGPEGLPDNSTTSVSPSLQPKSNDDNTASINSSNLVPNKVLPTTDGNTNIYGGKAMPNSPPVDSISDAFHPSIAVIIGVLSTMFSLTFLILLYAKHCKRPPVSVYGAHDTEVINPAPLAHLAGPATFLFADRDSGLDRAVVEALPMFSFSALKGMKEGLECAVCLSRYESPEILRLLPKCKHAFHLDCVDVWLSSHSTCPLCRVRVDAEDTLVLEDFMSGFNKLNGLGSEPPSTRQSARISLSDLADNYLDRAFELYVQREADSADILAGGCSWQYGSGRSSWRKLDAGSERKLGSWRSSANFSGPFGGSERKSELGSARVAPLQIKGCSEHHGSQRHAAEAVLPTLNVAAAGSVLPSNLAAAAGREADHDQCLYYYIDEELARRLGHRIIVSDVMFQHRWSDFLPSDVPFFDANTVMLRERSGIVSASGELAMKAAGNETEGVKEEAGEEEEVDMEAGTVRKKGRGSGGDRSTRMVCGGEKVVDIVEATTMAEKQKKQKRQGGLSSRNMRCMSELSGLQRVQQQEKQFLHLQAAGRVELADDVAPTTDDTARRRWLATARRTLRWLIGRSVGPNVASTSVRRTPPPSPINN